MAVNIVLGVVSFYALLLTLGAINGKRKGRW